MLRTVMSEEEKSLEYYRQRVREERPGVDKDSYSTYVISIVLQCVARKFGKEEANNLVDEFKLEELGWRKENGGRIAEQEMDNCIEADRILVLGQQDK